MLISPSYPFLTPVWVLRALLLDALTCFGTIDRSDNDFFNRLTSLVGNPVNSG
jgi:hypothetical protein